MTDNNKIILCCMNLTGGYIKFQCETIEELNKLVIPVAMTDLKAHYGSGFTRFLVKFVELWGEDMF